MMMASILYASDGGDFSTDMSYANSMQGSQSQAISTVNVKSLPNYSDHPSQEKYAGNANALKQAGKAALVQPNSAQNALSSAGKESQYYAGSNSDTINQAKVVQSNSYDIVHGISNKYVNCDQVHGDCHDGHCNNVGMACGGDFFCINGDCSKLKHEKNKQFNKAASQLAGAGSAGKDYKKKSKGKPINPSIPHPIIHIFNGKQMECSVAMIGAYNCCQDSGWLKGIIHNCSNEEKQLGIAKEKYLTVYIGEACAKSVLGFCTARHKHYCVFDNKEARIINQYGRAQVNLSWGSAKNPNCQGFTVQQFREINLDKVNFYNPGWMAGTTPKAGSPDIQAGYYGDLHKDMTLPDFKQKSQQMKKQIEAYVKSQTQSNNPNAASPLSRESLETQGVVQHD
jgi:hypothetical protein